MLYTTLKTLHITCVSLSVSLFVLRGYLQMAHIDWRRWHILRLAPHLIDTLLLASALWLAITLHQYPFVNGWLTAKVLALCAYIGFGKLALQAKQTKAQLPAFVAALLCVTYIVGVAVSHSATWALS